MSKPTEDAIVQSVPPDAFPGILREIARLASTAVAERLARRYGGDRLYIPLPGHLHEKHPLAAAIGLVSALKIAKELGGDMHAIPSARTLLRWIDAHRLKERGLNPREIGVRIGVSTGRVRQLLRAVSQPEAA